MRAVVYTRVSKDSTGEGLAVARQLEDARALAARRGWSIVAEYEDNDTTASGVKPRPGFDRVLADVAAGRAEAIVAWNIDRLTRSRRDTVRLIETAQQAKATIALCRGSDLDMSTPAGRMTAEILASVARSEIEVKSDRQRRANDQRAASGKPAAGPRPFGFERGGLLVKEDEAELVRQGYQLVLGGGSLRSVARLWNSSGLTTSKGSRWDGANVRRVLRNPRNAGLRAHRGEVVGKGEWPAIVDEDVYRALLHVLDDPARSTTKDRSVKYLLTSIAECGRCDDGSKVSTARTSHGVRTYKCKERGNLARAAAPIEEYVQRVALARLSRADAVDLVRQDPQHDIDALRSTARALRVQLDEAATLFASGAIRGTQLATITRSLEARLEAVESKLADAGRGNALLAVVGAGDVAKAWDGLDIMQQRAVLKELFARIVLDPVPQGAKRFRPESIRFVWRTE